MIQVTPNDSSIGLSGVTSMFLLDNNDPPVVTYLSVSGGEGLATVTLDLYDLEDDLIDLDFKYRGGSKTEWTTATMFDVLTGISADTDLIFEWDAETDENGYHATNYQLQVTPSDGETGSPVVFGPFEVDSNEPPEVTSVDWVSGTTGVITLSYDLEDDDGDLCSITVQFRGGTAGLTWMNATLSSGETSGIAAGTGILIQWNSAFNQPGFYGTDYQIRITPSDSESGTGSESEEFTVDNR
jgi:hypothetical protein